MEFPRILKEIKESPLHFSSQARVVPADKPAAKGFSGLEKRWDCILQPTGNGTRRKTKRQRGQIL
jgi:ribosomal protein L3